MFAGTFSILFVPFIVIVEFTVGSPPTRVRCEVLSCSHDFSLLYETDETIETCSIKVNAFLWLCFSSSSGSSCSRVLKTFLRLFEMIERDGWHPPEFSRFCN